MQTGGYANLLVIYCKSPKIQKIPEIYKCLLLKRSTQI